MKILFSLSLLFISCIVCKGQNKKLDSILSMMRDSGIATYGIGTVTTLHRDADSVWLSRDSTKYYYRYEKPKTDTIIKRIIYQYSDTALMTEWDVPYIIIDSAHEYIRTFSCSTKDITYHNKEVKWAYGYLVIVNTIHSSLEHYLDADKNKLWKNIIVWKYIEIE